MRNDEDQVEEPKSDFASWARDHWNFHWLPTLCAKSVRLHLPISREGAEQLCAACLDYPYTGHLEPALRDEPGLVIWILAKAKLAGAAELRTWRQVLDFLSQLWLPAALNWKPDETTFARDKPGSLEHYANIAARGMALAQLVKTLAEHRNIPDWEDASFLARVCQATTWSALNLSGIAEFMPDWIMESLEAIRHPQARAQKNAVGCVAEAMAILADKFPTEPAPPAEELQVDKEMARIRKLWCDPSLYRVSWMLLPVVAEKMSRLRQLESQFRSTVEAQKVESLKELAYGAGHEINNPLANISARAQTLLKEETDPEKRRKLAAINAQAFRAHEMIADMMLFARPPELQLEKLNAGELLAALVRELSARVAEQETSLIFAQPASAILIDADRTQLSVAVRALVVNACEALGRGGRIELAVQIGKFEFGRRDGDSPRSAVEISVTDNGPGISIEIRSHLFDPYFSGREANRGIGFGLCKCWRIVTAHGGRIFVQSDPGEGARFGLILPAADT